jgi:hypothetical protein
VLQFGEVDRAGEVLRIDRLTASPVVRAERRQG